MPEDDNYAIDTSGAYSSTLRNSPFQWPKFCVMDEPRPFTRGDNAIEQGAMYKVVTKANFPFHGSGYYDGVFVHHGLKYGLITREEITEVWLPSEPLDPQFITPYQDCISKHFDGLQTLPHDTKPSSLQKLLQLSFIGTMEQMDTTSQWREATMSAAMAAMMATSDGGEQVFLSTPFKQDTAPRYTVQQLHQLIAHGKHPRRSREPRSIS